MEDQHAHRPDPAVTAGHLVEVAGGVYAWIQPDGTWWLDNAGEVADPVRRQHPRARRPQFGNPLLPDGVALTGHEVMREHLLADPLIDGCPPAWDRCRTGAGSPGGSRPS